MRKLNLRINDVLLGRIVQTFAALLIAGLVLSAIGTTPSTSAGPRFDRCFPAKQWNAYNAYRPCVRIKRLYEDGSVVIGVYDHDGTERFDFSHGADDR